MVTDGLQFSLPLIILLPPSRSLSIKPWKAKRKMEMAVWAEAEWKDGSWKGREEEIQMLREEKEGLDTKKKNKVRDDLKSLRSLKDKEPSLTLKWDFQRQKNKSFFWHFSLTLSVSSWRSSNVTQGKMFLQPPSYWAQGLSDSWDRQSCHFRWSGGKKELLSWLEVAKKLNVSKGLTFFSKVCWCVTKWNVQWSKAVSGEKRRKLWCNCAWWGGYSLNFLLFKQPVIE